MLINLYIILGCIESSKELPPSRLTVASSGSMIQYGDLQGFLVTRGKPARSLLWKVDKITSRMKNCALNQIPLHSKALLVDKNIALAQDYLKTSSTPSAFVCAP